MMELTSQAFLGSLGTSVVLGLSEDRIMWRSFFLAVGLTAVFLGVECLGVEKMNLKIREPSTPGTPASFFSAATPPKEGPQKTLAPPRWAPWSLMSLGAVVCLYSFTLPGRWKGD